MSDILHCEVCSFPNLPMCNWHAPKFYKELESQLAEAHEDCIRLQQEINCLRMEPCQLPACSEARKEIASLNFEMWNDKRKWSEVSTERAALQARLDMAIEVLKKFDEYYLRCQKPSTHNGVTYPYSICIVCDMGQAGYSEAAGIHDTECPFRLAHETLAPLSPAPSAKEKP